MKTILNSIHIGAICGKNSLINLAIKQQAEYSKLSEHDKKLYELAQKVTTHVLYPFDYVFMRIKYIDSVNSSILNKNSIEISKYI